MSRSITQTRSIHSVGTSRLVGAATLLGIAMFGTNAYGQCGVPGSGDCCNPHAGTGCADESCCLLVCGSDPYCCDVGWDEYCAGNAAELCGGCEPVSRIVMGFGGSVTLPGGVTVGASDLAAFDPETGAWNLFIGGDQLGLSGATIGAVGSLSNGDLLLSFTGGGTVAGLVDGPTGGSVDGTDIVRFTPDTPGQFSQGTFSFYFDGSDVGLAGGSSITSLSVLDDGSLVMSTDDGGSIPGMGGFAKQDLIRFVPATLGVDTSGSWSMHFDGSDVGLGHNNEAIDALGVTAEGDLLMSTKGNASVPGHSSSRNDVMAFMATSFGSSTSGSFAGWFDGSSAGLSNGDNVMAFAYVTLSWPSGPRPGGGGGGGGGGGINPPTACGDQVAGDCCTVHDTPFCADASCCDLVCAADPLCCTATWDEYCVSAAAQICEPCMPAPLVVASFGGATTLPGNVVVDACDLAAFNTATGAWSIFFDGDDVGLAGMIVSGAAVLDDGDIVVALEGGGTVGGLIGGPNGSTVDAYDLIRFAPEQLGPATAGMWYFHFDGSDVGLSSSAGQAIAGFSVMADGSLLFATDNGGSLPGASSFKGQDLIRFVPSSLGQSTIGTWSMHFDGSDVGLSNNGEKIDAVFAEADGSIMMSSKGNVSAGSFGAGRSDIFTFSPTSTGSSTSGSMSTTYTASQLGLGNGVNLRGVFRTILVDPGTPRPPSVTATVMFDRMPDAAVQDLAIEQGHVPYIIIYQGTDPNAATSGVIDANRVVEAIRANHGDNPTGYGVLDFENPFFDRLQAGPSDPNYQLTVDTIVNLLQTVKAEFPGVQWTMYGMPRLRYWFSNGHWANRTEAEREAELTATLESYTPILRHMDWLNPSVYDRYELGLYAESSWSSVTARETAYRSYNMELCHRFNASEETPKPVIPMVSPMFWKVGNIEYNMKLTPIEELLRDQVRPLIEGGATKVAFWTGYPYWTRIATSAEDFGTLQQEARYSMTQDYLGGVEPLTWVDEQLKLDLETMTSEYVLQRLGEVKADIESILSGPDQNGP